MADREQAPGGVLVVAAGIELVPADFQQHVALLEAGLGRAGFRHDAGHHHASGLVAEFEVGAELVVERRGEFDPEAGEAGVGTVGGVVEERLDDGERQDRGDLVVAVVAQQHAGEMAVLDDRQGEAAFAVIDGAIGVELEEITAVDEVRPSRAVS